MKKFLIFLAVLTMSVLFVPKVFAASLLLSPSTGAYKVGDSFSVQVFVASNGTAINAVSGLVTYPVDKLSLTNISSSGSIINFWTVNPIKEVNGAHFEGVVLNPGYTGSSGKIVTLNFKVLKEGVATLLFSSAAILANDGLGTNVLETIGSATYSLGAAAPISTTPAGALVPLAPVVSSRTHPDPEKWYPSRDVELGWTLEEGTTGAAVLVDELPNTNPGTKSLGTITSYAQTLSADGVWYAHVRLLNKYGWGGVSHFRLQTDTVAPSLFTIETQPTEEQVPFVKLKFTATDELSGIDQYKVSIDGGEENVWTDSGTSIYISPHLTPGKHTLIAKAFDKAGNNLAASVDFEITAIEKPVIEKYPKNLKDGDFLILSGHSYPDARIAIILKPTLQESTSYFGTVRYQSADVNLITRSVIADRNGLFTFAYDERVHSGIYTVYAIAELENGAQSLPSDSVIIVVSQTLIERIVGVVSKTLILLIPFIGLLALLAGLIWYIWYRYRLFKNRVKREVYQAEESIRSDIGPIDEKLRAEVILLRKLHAGEPLAAHEVAFLEQLDREIAAAAGHIMEKVEDINQSLGK